MALRIDRSRSAERIAADVRAVTGPRYTMSDSAICRYAYTDAYRNTLTYFADSWRELGFDVREDPIGNLVARNRPAGVASFGIGSHVDSVRTGGIWDGPLGVATALEICRLNLELELDLPLQAISFLEEEGSGFGQLLLGSRIAAQLLDEHDLRERICAVDDRRPFWDHATAAGYRPERFRDCARILDDLIGWIELHIEQGRLLQDRGLRVGIVEGIVGYVHGDLTIDGRADHAGATPMDMRYDSLVVAAMVVAELERRVLDAGHRTVGTVGEIDAEPGLINVIPGRTRLSLDVRGPDDAVVRSIVSEIVAFASELAERRGLRAVYTARQSVHATPMDRKVVGALQAAATEAHEPTMMMTSGAVHDTMCVATRSPSAMVFVPCKDGLSHTPLEEANPEDAAVAAELMLNAIAALAVDATS